MIISLPDGYFYRNKQRPLSKLMIAALVACCKKQRCGKPLGGIDINHSFTALVKRGLIVGEHIIAAQQPEVIWKVTDEAIEMLKSNGIEVLL